VRLEAGGSAEQDIGARSAQQIGVGRYFDGRLPELNLELRCGSAGRVQYNSMESPIGGTHDDSQLVLVGNTVDPDTGVQIPLAARSNLEITIGGNAHLKPAVSIGRYLAFASGVEIFAGRDESHDRDLGARERLAAR
jgi:hypothetical protein